MIESNLLIHVKKFLVLFHKESRLKNLLLLSSLYLGGCSLVALPIAVVETTVSIVKVPISVVGSVADTVSGDDKEQEEE